MTDEEKVICILQFSGQKKDWLVWADTFLAGATFKGYDEILLRTILATGESRVNEDGNPKELSKAKKHANNLNKKVYNEVILSCSDKISFLLFKMQKRLGIS